MNQRKTQTAEYWQKQFQLDNKEIENIYQYILEKNRPARLDELAISLVARHCEAEELATRRELQEGDIYQPNENYTEGQSLIFPALDFAMGEVIATREGNHPEYGTFVVISVDFNGDGVREFASNLTHDHPLNASKQSLANLQGLMTPEEVYDSYRQIIAPKVAATLEDSEEFVKFHDQFFLRDALPEFQEGLFNIADAAIDINQGPLSVEKLIEQMGLTAENGSISEGTRFAVNYRLANDPRFDDVGPTGQILWYLDRIEPPEAHHPPRRLKTDVDYDPSLFDEDLYALLANIDDETIHPEDVAPVDPEADSATLVLNYPSWRVGTLPLTPKTRPFFPTSQYNPVLFEFVDGRTGDTFPGWAVSEHDYVFGLGNWFQENKLPVGAYVTIKRTDDPMRIIVDYESTRTQRDWVRMIRIVGHRLTFQMNPAAISCEYDELMIISDPDPAATDRLWLNAEERDTSIYNLLCDIFPELSKLNPQSTVHATTLYSAVNVIRRIGPGPVFEELASHACFIPMDHGYWTFDPSLRD